MFTLPRTESELLAHPTFGDRYRVDVALPEGPPPRDGWPCVYLLDAWGAFGTSVEAMRRMSRRPDATGVSPTVIVGISSPEEGYDVRRRQRDFTTPRAKVDPTKVDSSSDEGGAAAFLAFLEDAVKPFALGRYAVDARRQTLFGHSLGGYFALWTLVERPAAFRNYASISPSIWWDREALLSRVPRLAGVAARVLLAVGEWEEALPPWQLASPGSAEVAARRKDRGMIAHARELAEALERALGSESVRFRLLPDEDHVSIVSAALPRTLRLACA